MFHENYNEKMKEMINNIPKGTTLLLHTCCAPCSSTVIANLSKYFTITIFYYNPNIEPEEEYEKRKEEQKRFIKEYPSMYPISFLDCDYEPEKFHQIAKGYEEEKERGARCPRCFRLRLEKTAQMAKEKGFQYFGTSLTVSPYKNALQINEIGKVLEQEYHIPFLYSDFKKENGYQKSIELSKEYHLYRQDYCGCVYSKKEKNLKSIIQ